MKLPAALTLNRCLSLLLGFTLLLIGSAYAGQSTYQTDQSVRMSDYEEIPLMIPGVDAPVGLDVSFSVKQATAQTLYVSLVLDGNGAKFGAVCDTVPACLVPISEPPFDVYSVGTTEYQINDDEKHTVRFRCVPLDRNFNAKEFLSMPKRAQAIQDPKLNAELRRSGKLYAVFWHRIPIWPKCLIAVGTPLGWRSGGCAADYNVPSHCRMDGSSSNRIDWQDRSDMIPTQAQLLDVTFWENAYEKSSPAALIGAGYVVCDALNPNLYCLRNGQ